MSTLVNDLAEEVWGYKKCAMMSLKGGKSPKNPSAEIKPHVPVGAVEAIFGVYLAHLKWQGMTNETHIDAAMKQAEGFLTSKLNESARKLKRRTKKITVSAEGQPTEKDSSSLPK